MHWFLWQAFKWSARLAVFAASCYTAHRIITQELDYRVDMGHVVTIGAAIIVTVRLWMPWKEEDA